MLGFMLTAVGCCAGPPDEVTAACDRDDNEALLRLAERGEPTAHLCLGIMYEEGKGVSQTSAKQRSGIGSPQNKGSPKRSSASVACTKMGGGSPRTIVRR